VNVEFNSNRSVAINRDTKWIPIDANTPRGSKLQLISKAAGVAHYGTLGSSDDFYTHWFPLPTFNKDET
jgi:hypothetical protein